MGVFEGFMGRCGCPLVGVFQGNAVCLVEDP